MHHYRQQVTQGIYRYVSLAAFDLLARIEPALPPFSADLALCESMMATVGSFVLPACTRTTVQFHQDLLPNTALLQPLEGGIHREPRAELLG
jgi:hypothetical protein